MLYPDRLGDFESSSRCAWWMNNCLQRRPFDVQWVLFLSYKKHYGVSGEFCATVLKDLWVNELKNLNNSKAFDCSSHSGFDFKNYFWNYFSATFSDLIMAFLI